jgi:hypothetical protein
MWEVPLPCSPVEPSSQHCYKLSCSKVAGQVLPLLPSPASLFIYSSMRDCSSPLFSAQGTLPSLLHVFLLLLLFIIQFFPLFPWVGGQSVQGAMLICPRVVCGSTACHLAHLMVCFSQADRSWHLAAWEPSWFLHLLWNGDAMCGLGVWQCQFYLFLVVFPTRCVSIVSPRFYFRKHAFCFLPLVAILESSTCDFKTKKF